MDNLDLTLLEDLSVESFQVLTAIEVAMKNHDLVPETLVVGITNLKADNVNKLLEELCKHKLLNYEHGSKCEGYYLTTAGYDYLALKSLKLRGSFSSVGKQIGSGSNVYMAMDNDNNRLCLKLHYFGRTCSKNAKSTRDSYEKRYKASWIYLSRISAMREFAFMTALHQRGFPVPKPIDFNRHCVIMELINGSALTQTHEVADVQMLYDKIMYLIVCLGNNGIIHGQIEYHIMVTDEGKPILIDFPQMMSVSHSNAEHAFMRDVTAIKDFFLKKFDFVFEVPVFPDLEHEDDLDAEVRCTGLTKEMANDLLTQYGMMDYDDSDDEEGFCKNKDYELKGEEIFKIELEQYQNQLEIEVKFAYQSADSEPNEAIKKYMQSCNEYLGKIFFTDDLNEEQVLQNNEKNNIDIPSVSNTFEIERQKCI